MGKARNLQQFRKGVRARLLQHPTDKARPEFRYSECSGFAEYLLRRDPQHFGTAENLHDIRIVGRDCLRIDSGQILQHPDYGRIIVSKYIQFQHVIMDGVEVEVGRFPLRVLRIGRELDRCEIIDIHVVRNDDDAAGMLSGRPFHARAAFCQPVDFRR
ncbi:hypothetical protein SDC9_125719 [bioreactor metagenome]|uniref:Uncharacterized protein n=1 Tax=bioreactor metagenome TaxID=1076179 RepID=A0A645CP85_9ZZZZ